MGSVGHVFTTREPCSSFWRGQEANSAGSAVPETPWYPAWEVVAVCLVGGQNGRRA